MNWWLFGTGWIVLSVITGLIFGRILARISAQYPEPGEAGSASGTIPPPTLSGSAVLRREEPE